jgi:hypothetical protein
MIDSQGHILYTATVIRRYNGDWDVALRAFLISLPIAILIGAFIGICFYFTEQILGAHLFGAYSALGGLIAGFIFLSFSSRLKLHQDVLIYLSGTVIAICSFFTYHYTFYEWQFKPEVYKALNTQAGRIVEAEEANKIIQENLKFSTGSDGFLGFLNLETQIGFVSQRSVMGTAVFSREVTGSNVISYWLIEMALIVFAIIVVFKRFFDIPFDKDGGCWFGPRFHLGSTRPDEKDYLKELVLGEQVDALGNEFNNQTKGTPRIDAYIRRSLLKTSPSIYLVIGVVKKGYNGENFKAFSTLLISQAQLDTMASYIEGVPERLAQRYPDISLQEPVSLPDHPIH